MATQRILDFIARENLSTPCLVLDLEAVADNYRTLAAAMPGTAIHYAVKANPDPAVLSRLRSLGCRFDVASVQEAEMTLAAGAPPEWISYGNTIKKERDIAKAFALGVRLYAVDSVEEAAKVARAAPGASVYCRILTDGEGADWPLSRKFGCDVDMAVETLTEADRLGLVADGVSFHVGSQQTDLGAWDRALADAKRIFDLCAERGVFLGLVNLGGGFPARYLKDVPAAAAYGEAISAALRRHFGDNVPRTIAEPGRGLVGAAGAVASEVVLVSRKSAGDAVRWVYLDVGKFGGLAETMEEAIRYPIVTRRDGDPKGPCIVAGPTCDSADVLYEKVPYDLPETLRPGDVVLFDSAGAYTTTYSAVAFNGFPPLAAYVI